MSIKALIRRWRLRKNVERLFPDFRQEILNAFLANFGYVLPLSLLAKIQTICKEIKPKLVIEFGSGLSTVVITDALSQSEGFLITIDESMKWLANSYQLVNHASQAAFICLPDNGAINHAALSKYLLAKAKPELVIIDAPSGAERFSQPALEVCAELLSLDCVCVVDDTDREENDSGAGALATQFSLRKVDYDDPIYRKHQYSILLPRRFDDRVLPKSER